MKLMDAWKIYMVLADAEDEIRAQADGEEVRVGPAKQKLWGKRKRVTILVENDT